jgi:hypothetical protein
LETVGRGGEPDVVVLLAGEAWAQRRTWLEQNFFDMTRINIAGKEERICFASMSFASMVRP